MHSERKEPAVQREGGKQKTKRREKRETKWRKLIQYLLVQACLVVHEVRMARQGTVRVGEGESGRGRKRVQEGRMLRKKRKKEEMMRKTKLAMRKRKTMAMVMRWMVILILKRVMMILKRVMMVMMI